MAAPPTAAQPAVDLDALLLSQTVWKAARAPSARDATGESTGHAALDEALPQRGWPRRALTELLLPADGIGELALLLPTLARFTRAGGTVALIAPPYLPYAPAWQSAGVDLRHLEIVDADPRNALWAFEQCLRSAACAAVVGWPLHADGPALRRLQVAADTGDCLGFALRDRRHAANPSPAALRLEYVPAPGDMGDAMATAVPGVSARVAAHTSAPAIARGMEQAQARSNVHAHAQVRLQRIARTTPRTASLPAPMTRSLSLFPGHGAAMLVGPACIDAMRRIDVSASTHAARNHAAGVHDASPRHDASCNDDTDLPLASFVDFARLRALAAQARARGECADSDAMPGREGIGHRPARDATAARGDWYVRKCRGGNLPLHGIALPRLN